jgi:hypothetical protein
MVIEIVEVWKTRNDAFQVGQGSLFVKEQGYVASKLIFELGRKNI